MFVSSIKPLKIGQIVHMPIRQCTLEKGPEILYEGPSMILREVSEQEYLDKCEELFGARPTKNYGYVGPAPRYYEVSID